MRVGHQMPNFSYVDPEQLGTWVRDVAQAADGLGYDSLWVMDHFFQLGGWLGEPEEPMLEGYTTLGYFAGITERIPLGLLVGGVIYRAPAIVIKIISTLDVLSGGRTYMGIGAAWYEKESESLGLPFPTMKERFEQLEDILQLAHHMWSGNTEPFEGKQFTLPYPVNNPQPLQDPHPPILIGGMGEKKTLLYVAKYADACNLSGAADEDTLRHKLDVLKNHCEDVGRSYDEIEKTVIDTIKLDEESMADVVARWKGFAALGLEHVMFNIKGAYTPETLSRINDEVVAKVREV